MIAGYQVLLVIPAYREAGRLPSYLRELSGVLSHGGFSTAILIVDDGSPIEEQQALRGLIEIGTIGSCEILQPLVLPENRGKGGAVLAGWRSGVKADWLAFVDADGALSAAEVLRVLRLAVSGQQQTVYCASRVGEQQRLVRRRWNRWLLGRAFAQVVRFMLNLGISDSQCGFKLLPAACFHLVDPQLQEQGYCFDLELLLALQRRDVRIVEVPVNWLDQPGGKVRPLRDGIRMLRQLCRLRKRFRQ
jgi:glycosyltransferase involved in cell wall biosynthesis